MLKLVLMKKDKTGITGSVFKIIKTYGIKKETDG